MFLPTTLFGNGSVKVGSTHAATSPAARSARPWPAGLPGLPGGWFRRTLTNRSLGGRRADHSLRLDDLAIVCSNCHRMIRRTKPMMSVEDFRDKYKPRSGASSASKCCDRDEVIGRGDRTSANDAEADADHAA